MKKMICLFLAIILVLSLAACSEKGSKAKTNDNSQDEYIKVIETTRSSTQVEEGYLYHIPNLSFPLKQTISVHWERSFTEDTPRKATRDTVFGDPELQGAAKDIAKDLNLTTVSGCLEYANAIIPHIEATDYFETPETGWELDFIFIYEDGICSASYDEYWRADNYAEMTEQERRSTVKMDGGITVIFSMVDGHIICLEGSHYATIEGKEPYTEQEESVWITKPNDVYLVYSDVSMEGHFTGWSGIEAEQYQGAPLDPAHEWDNAQMQKEAAALTDGLQLFTAEGMTEYSKRLGFLLSGEAYRIFSQDYKGDYLTRYTDGVWEIKYRTSDSDPACSVFISEEDGHIIHFIFEKTD